MLRTTSSQGPLTDKEPVSDFRCSDITKHISVIGIDFGAVKCCLSVIMENKKVVIVPSETGSTTFPAYVTFLSTGGRLTGERARNMRYTESLNTLTNIKRFCGRTKADPICSSAPAIPEFMQSSDEMSISSHQDDSANCILFLSLLMFTMVHQAEKFLHGNRLGLIVSIPPSFDAAQRSAILDAAEIIYRPVNRLLSDPVAAAIAFYDHEEAGLLKGRTSFVLLILDVGACSSDVSVVRLSTLSGLDATPVAKVTMLTSVGDAALGGMDFDRNLSEMLLRELKPQERQTLCEDRAAMQRLLVACEQLKCTLSVCPQANMELMNLANNINIFSVVKRQQFEEANRAEFDRIANFVHEALRVAQLHEDDIDEVVMLGGSSRIPWIKRKVKEIFHGRDLYTALSSDQAVACGTSLFTTGKFEVCDIVNVTYGVPLPSGLMQPLIRKGEPLPARVVRNFFTTEDSQTSMKIEIYEGERSTVRHNRLCASCMVNDIPPGLKGSGCVQLIIVVDINGIMCLSIIPRFEASDLPGGYQQIPEQVSRPDSMVNFTGRMSKGDIKKMFFVFEHLVMEDKMQKMQTETLKVMAQRTLSIVNDSNEQLTSSKKNDLSSLCAKALRFISEGKAQTTDQIDEYICTIHQAYEALDIEKCGSEDIDSGQKMSSQSRD